MCPAANHEICGWKIMGRSLLTWRIWLLRISDSGCNLLGRAERACWSSNFLLRQTTGVFDVWLSFERVIRGSLTGLCISLSTLWLLQAAVDSISQILSDMKDQGNGVQTSGIFECTNIVWVWRGRMSEFRLAIELISSVCRCLYIGHWWTSTGDTT